MYVAPQYTNFPPSHAGGWISANSDCTLISCESRYPEDNIMTTTDPNVPESADDSAAAHTHTRTPRGIRFSDSEWESVKDAAIRHKISAAEFVRNATLSAIATAPEEDSGTIPPGIVKLIKHTYRSVYILSTLKRDEMLDDGRIEELNQTVALAKQSQRELSNDSPK